MYTNLDKDKKTFCLDHCWNLLKDEDKWKLKMVELAELEKIAANRNKKKAAKVSRPRDEVVAVDNDEVVAVDDGSPTAQRKRSDGIKKVQT